MQVARSLYFPIRRTFVVRGPVRLGDDVHIGPGSRVECWRGLDIGNDVYVGKYCSIVVDGSIGNDVLIANNVGLVGRHDHDHRAIGVGIRRAPWIGDEDYEGPGLSERLVVEDDVWIGFGSVVLSGATIGRGAIVAAGSVVIDDVPPYSIVAGNPAAVISHRFDESEIAEHEFALYGKQVTPKTKFPSAAPGDVAVEIEVASGRQGDADDLNADRGRR